jgi:ZIP family zinc transporter
MRENLVSGLLLTTAAGLATAVGAALFLLLRKSGPRFMGFTLGFSAGVMMLVSFVELLQKSIESVGFFSAHVAFFAGMGAILLVDMLVPHDYMGQHDHPTGGGQDGLYRVGLLTAFGIGIHNFPEGMATLAGSLKDPSLGVAIAVAIGVHNVPEGMAVAAPIYAATGSRRKAFLWSALSGLSEPIGASVAALVLLPFLSEALLGWILAAVAGLMVSISLDELVPAAKSYDSGHAPILGAIMGMAVMALSLWLLR